jgi:hypothetical protein
MGLDTRPSALNIDPQSVPNFDPRIPLLIPFVARDRRLLALLIVVRR